MFLGRRIGQFERQPGPPGKIGNRFQLIDRHPALQNKKLRIVKGLALCKDARGMIVRRVQVLPQQQNKPGKQFALALTAVEVELHILQFQL